MNFRCLVPQVRIPDLKLISFCLVERIELIYIGKLTEQRVVNINLKIIKKKSRMHLDPKDHFRFFVCFSKFSVIEQNHEKH